LERHIEQFCLDLNLPIVFRHTIIEALDGVFGTRERRSWTMITDDLHHETCQWLKNKSKYPTTALAFYNGLFRFIDYGTCELRVGRRHLAHDAGLSTAMVTRLMAELKSLGVITTIKRGRNVVYAFNSHVGTKMAGEARRALKASTSEPTFPELRLVPTDKRVRRDDEDEHSGGEAEQRERTG